MVSHEEFFTSELVRAVQTLPQDRLVALVEELVYLRGNGGRLFVIGVGGGAANAAHSVNDFRKLCDIEAYAPTDNVAELTARTNDEGWASAFHEWLAGSHLSGRDALMIYSVGGGTPEVSPNIYWAVEYALAHKAKVFGVVGKPDGATAKRGQIVIVTSNEIASELLTPITETLQLVVNHYLVSHPRLQRVKTKW